MCRDSVHVCKVTTGKLIVFVHNDRLIDIHLMASFPGQPG